MNFPSIDQNLDYVWIAGKSSLTAELATLGNEVAHMLRTIAERWAKSSECS